MLGSFCLINFFKYLFCLDICWSDRRKLRRSTDKLKTIVERLHRDGYVSLYEVSVPLEIYTPIFRS
ncbi:hypothetical protein S7335_3136 [Synechococcus sp. PCC 7335]|nr:hypothetical protein S7335_3136 [Synechococcus sp. PCC 7335]